MKATTIVLGLVASTASLVKAEAVCQSSYEGSYLDYYVIADKVTNPGAVCDTLWRMLRRFGSCLVTAPSCGVDPDFGNDFVWRFQVPIGCNGGMIESSWWEATQNRFGGIDC